MDRNRQDLILHALMLALCAAVVVASFVFEPGAEVVKVFGRTIPSLCVFRNTFGVPCPGCGMTRSFVFLGHGDVWAALRMNPLGPALFLLVASQVPYRAFRILRLARAD
jgi:hypothetical protein